MIVQLIINIVLTATIYLLVAFSFLMIYLPSKFINIAHAGSILIAPYLTYLFEIVFNISFPYSLIIAILGTTLIGVGSELIVLKQIRVKRSTELILLIASLGLYIIFQNSISLLFGDDMISLNQSSVRTGNEFLGAYINDMQIITILVCISLSICTIILLNITKLGKRIRAISSNERLTNIFGVNINRTYLVSYIIGTSLAAVAGILVAYDNSMTPTLGFNLLVYGIIAIIIGGIGSLKGLIAGSLFLASAQHLGAFYIDSKWINAIAYLILILFLIFKPKGFSGKQLKKVEI